MAASRFFLIVLLSTLTLHQSLKAQSYSYLKRALRGLPYEPQLAAISDYEAEVISQWKKVDTISRMDLILLSDPKANEARKIRMVEVLDSISLVLDPRMKNATSPIKQGRILDQWMAKQILKDYRRGSSLWDLLTQGYYDEYNTAILYTYLLDHWQVPHQLYFNALFSFIDIEYQKRIYRIEIAHPDPDKVLYSGEFMMDYLAYLQYDGIWQRRDSSFFNPSNVFLSYFLPEQALKLHELVGLTYLSKGLSLSNDQQTDRALPFLEKAFFFYPSVSTKYLLYRNYSTALVQYQQQLASSSAAFGRIYAMFPREATAESLSRIFLRMTYATLIDKESSMDYDSLYQKIQEGVEHTELKEKLSDHYYVQLGRYSVRQRAFLPALNYFSEVKIPPPDFRPYVNQAVIGQLQLISACQERKEFLQSQTDIFGFLREEKLVQGLVNDCQ